MPMHWAMTKSIQWYYKGLFHPLTIIFAGIIVIALIESLNRPEPSRANWIWLTLEWLLFPLYFLQAALHIVRDPKTTVFELNLIRSWKTLFLARIAVFLASLTIVVVPSSLLLYLKGFQDMIIPLALKGLEYTTIVSIAILLQSRRGALAFIITTAIILPSASLGVISNVPPGQKLGTVESITLYFVSPILLHMNSQLLSMDEHVLWLVTIAISTLLMLGSFIIFIKGELHA